jgi:hypothetical protein
MDISAGGHWYNSSSINDDRENDESKTEEPNKKSNKGRHKLFQLELVFVKRNIERDVEYFNKTLMGFDGHPMGKKNDKHLKHADD